MDFTSQHGLEESVTLPDGKTGIIKAVTFDAPTNPTYHVEVPEQTITVPASTEDVKLDE